MPLGSFFPPVIIGGPTGGVPGVSSQPPGGEFWSRIVAAADLARGNPARSIDTELQLAVVSGSAYMVRAMAWFSAEQGGPTLTSRVVGPAVSYAGLRLTREGGAQDAGAFNPAYIARVNTFDVADNNAAMNTGGPGRAVLMLAVEGLFIPSANGTFGIEWTGSVAAPGDITRRKGSYIEYRKL